MASHKRKIGIGLVFLKQVHSLLDEVVLDWNGEVLVVKIPVKE